MEYTKLLISIGKLISDSELLAMKFICREFEGRKTLEEIETPLDLWNVLEQRLKLSADNMTFLKSMLLQINREDLAALVDEYSKSTNNVQPEPHNLIGTTLSYVCANSLSSSVKRLNMYLVIPYP